MTYYDVAKLEAMERASAELGRPCSEVEMLAELLDGASGWALGPVSALELLVERGKGAIELDWETSASGAERYFLRHPGSSDALFVSWNLQQAQRLVTQLGTILD